MGSGTQAPNFVNPTISGTTTTFKTPFGMRTNTQGGLPGGNLLEKYAQDLLQNGLPKDIQENYLKQGQGQISGNLRSGEEALREQLASQGNVPIGASTGGIAGLRTNANSSLNDLNSNLAGMNFNAKQSGFGDYSSLINQAMGLSGQQNQYGLEKYNIDKSNEFSFGKAIGGLLGAGGQIGSAAIGKPK